MNTGDIRSTPNPLSGTHQPSKSISNRRAVQKDDSVAPGTGTGEANELISAAEVKYFEDLFPQSAKEIRSYATYHKEGKIPPAVLGSIIDRKG